MFDEIVCGEKQDFVDSQVKVTYVLQITWTVNRPGVDFIKRLNHFFYFLAQPGLFYLFENG